MKGKKISQSFQRWLLVVVLIAFLVTTTFLWFSQTQLSINNSKNLLALNISDVRQDILDATDEHLLSLTYKIADELDTSDEITSYRLEWMALKHGVSEINYINEQGVIEASTYPDFINYIMASGEQSGEFLVLLSGDKKEHVQKYGPVTYDSSISRKYGGVVLRRGGFVQVGYDAARFRRDVDEFVVGVTRNRHVGAGGCLIIADEKGAIVSDRHGYEGQSLEATGLSLDFDAVAPGQLFTSQVYGKNCYCMYETTEGYTIVAAMPQQEAALSRNVSVGITTAMEILVFASLFVLIYVLIKHLIVNNILQINHSLSQITDGDLSVVVDVRSHQEFSSLSDDINSTVDTLKRYIDDAAARIDAELAFAKAIQHSALPSVFPPYPNRKEFDIWAAMYTAKEVGGDFYDFYFVDDDNLIFLVADVSGKGIPAAMFMMTAKTLLKSFAESGMAAEEVFTQANEKLCQGNDAGMFVTAWMGMLNTRTGKVTYVNAGHNPPVIRQKNGDFVYLKSRAGFVLAGMEGVRYRRNELQLEPGDVIYLYTDGVTEATNLDNQLYGEDRLLAQLNLLAQAPVQQICDDVKADVDLFVGEAPQFDDITMVCLRYNGENI